MANCLLDMYKTIFNNKPIGTLYAYYYHDCVSFCGQVSTFLGHNIPANSDSCILAF